MISFRIITASMGIVVASLALAGCQTIATPPNSAPPSGTPAASASPDPVATPSVTTPPPPAEQPFVMPTDCKKLMAPSVYTANKFGSTPLNPPWMGGPDFLGVVTPKVAPPGSQPPAILRQAASLRCIWTPQGADTTNIMIEVGYLDPSITGPFLTSYAANGYTCTNANGTRKCGIITQNSQYPVKDGHTLIVHGNVYVDINQSNFPTSGVGDSIIATLWG